MLLDQKEQGSSVVQYAPIVKALCFGNLNEAAKKRLKRKFDVAYMIAKQNLAFTKMSAVCGLEERHGPDLGAGYKNDHSCATFVKFIAQEQADNLTATIAKCRFFSLQADSSTDCGNNENELFMIVYFDSECDDGMVHVRDRFFTTRFLQHATAEGLYDAYTNAMRYMGLEESKSKMIGFGCDGTNANIADGGLKGLLTRDFPWLVVV